MHGNLWSDEGKTTRTKVLADFDQAENEKQFNRLKVYASDFPSQAEALIRIERFVDYVLANDAPAYKYKRRLGYEFSETRVGRRARKTFPLHFLFDSKHFYSEKPLAFLRACQQIGRLYEFRDMKRVRNRYEVDARYAEIMNLLIDTIRHLAKEEWFKRVARDRRYQASCNGEKAASYTAEVLNYYARSEIVRLDFGYTGGAAAPVKIERAWHDFHDFLQLLEFHPLFKKMTGYIWSIEQGADKGFHMHVAFFFDGSEVCQDIVVAKLIGEELWVDRVTQGWGTYYNCNRHKERYDKVGIGTIHRDNEEECLNAIRCMQYLPKGGEFLDRDDQYLRIKHKERMHTFGTGQAPDILAKRRGRPAAPAPWLDAFRGHVGA
jgi:hypothetical protein